MTTRLHSTTPSRACRSLGAALLLAAGACDRADPPTAPATAGPPQIPAPVGRVTPARGGGAQLPLCRIVVCAPRLIDWSYASNAQPTPHFTHSDWVLPSIDFTRSLAVVTDGGQFKDLREMTLRVTVKGGCLRSTGTLAPGTWEAHPESSIDMAHVLATGTPPVLDPGPRVLVLFQVGELMKLPCYSPQGALLIGGRLRPVTVRATLSYRTDGNAMYAPVDTSESLRFISN